MLVSTLDCEKKSEAEFEIDEKYQPDLSVQYQRNREHTWLLKKEYNSKVCSVGKRKITDHVLRKKVTYNFMYLS